MRKLALMLLATAALVVALAPAAPAQHQPGCAIAHEAAMNASPNAHAHENICRGTS
jgi:hypothetical protein